MAAFSSLAIRGYRRLIDVSLQLRPLNVLIGANGVGKSSLLEALRLLGLSADRRLSATVTESGGLQSILTADGKISELALEIGFERTDNNLLKYELVLAERGAIPSLKVIRERLEQHQFDSQPPKSLIDFTNGRGHYYMDNLLRPQPDYSPCESALSQSQPSHETLAFGHALASTSAIHHSLDVSRRAPVRTPQRLSPAQTPGPNGEDLVSCLFTIRETARDRYEAIEDALRAAFSSFERLEFPPVAAGLLSLGWRDSQFTRPFYSSELSEGTLRFLWLATLLQSPGLPAITLIDEPEVSLHPEMLRLLTELMREASARTVLVVATQSDRFVRFLEPAELVVCDEDESGGTTVRRADELDLKAWMEEYTLDQLWSMGRLGGRA